MKQGVFFRILISLVGSAFIIWGICLTALGLVGEYTNAAVNDISREGGERTDGKAGRYTYNISYSFILPDGKIQSGTTKQIGSAIYIKADGSGKIPIRYFKAMPFINAPQYNCSFSFGQPILIGAGVILVVAVNRKTE